MATLKESIYSTLTGDATLRTLLSKTVSPYGIYYFHPPKNPPFPIISYYELAISGDFPRIGAYGFTVWSGDRDAIGKQIFELLHNKSFSVTDLGFIKFLNDGATTELWDTFWHVYYRQFRYGYKAIKTT